MKAKAIAEFKVAKAAPGSAEPMDTSKSVEYEPYSLPDGTYLQCIRVSKIDQKSHYRCIFNFLGVQFLHCL